MSEEEDPRPQDARAIVPVSEESSGLLVRFSETLGEAFDALVGLPGVRRNLAKAVSQVVLGVADVAEAVLDIGKAKAQQYASRVRSQTRFEEAAIDQARTAVEAGEDPIDHRARLYDFFRGRREQRNREAVLQAVLDDMVDRPPSRDTSSEINEDWLMYFSDAASKISDDAVQAFLATMLRGELTEPGAFSVDAVIRISTMSPRIAERFNRFSIHTSAFPNSAGILVGPMKNPQQHGLPELGLSWDDLTELQSAGLVKVDLSSQVTLSPVPANKEIHFRFCGRPAILPTTKEANSIVLRTVLATRAGVEILGAISPPAAAPMPYSARMRDWFRSAHGLELTF